MRVAVIGANGAGKTTLIEDFVAARREYQREEEPYWGLVQQGMPFAGGASLPDLEEQLDASAALILAQDSGQIVFDRCPIDFIAYLEVVGEDEAIEWMPSGKQLRQVEHALSTLDLLVFLPVSRPDEIAARIELPRLRGRVDARLKAILREDARGLLGGVRPKLLEISGDRDARVRRLAKAIGP